MSTGAALAPVPEPAPPAKEAPHVTDAYRKAHKSYVLVSGLLASWELIGITLQTKDKWGIELKSPTAVPLILFVLVFYSGYKLTIEWLQCDTEPRKNRAAKLDYVVAHLIAATAIGISVVQYLARIQIVDALSRPHFGSGKEFFVFVYIAVYLGYLTPAVRKMLLTSSKGLFPGLQKVTSGLLIGIGLSSAIMSVVSGVQTWKINRWEFMIILLGGIIAAVASIIAASWFSKREVKSRQ